MVWGKETSDGDTERRGLWVTLKQSYVLRNMDLYDYILWREKLKEDEC